MLAIIPPDVGPVQHVLAPLKQFHNDGTNADNQCEKDNCFDHYRTPCNAGNARMIIHSEGTDSQLKAAINMKRYD